MSVRPYRLIYRDTASSQQWTRRAYTRPSIRDEVAGQLRAIGMEVEAWDVIELPLPEVEARRVSAPGGAA